MTQLSFICIEANRCLVLLTRLDLAENRVRTLMPDDTPRLAITARLIRIAGTMHRTDVSCSASVLQLLTLGLPTW